MSDNILRNRHEVVELVSSGKLDGVLVEEVDLSKTGLANVTTTDATFRKIGLHDADATGGDYSRTKFTESSLRGARFSDSLLRASSFFASELIEGRFDSCTMSNSSYFGCRLGNADFTGSRITSGTFNGCELFGAKFTRSLMVNTRFDAPERGNVTLDRADFSNAILIDCDLMGANLYGANFNNALLIKVDLRHTNLAATDFEGAHLIDVHLDTSMLEPDVSRAVEAARVDDPWRRHGFMREVLDSHSDEEMQMVLEYVLRTYVIEGAQPSQPADSFGMLLAQLKARHDFPELDRLRLRGTSVQVQTGGQWHDLLGEVVSASSAEPPAPAPVPATADTADRPAASMPDPTPPPAPAPAAAASSPPAAAPPAAEKAPPKNVGRSKRFRSLEID